MSDMPPDDARAAKVEVDFTKTKSYALTDLAVKTISAVAIVVLGIAGWMLQRGQTAAHTADDQRRQSMEDHERDERKYLPTLRSLTEVDLVLATTSADYAWPTHDANEVIEESRLGSHLAYLGDSMFFPDGEPNLLVVNATDNAVGTANPTAVKLPARAAVLMLAEMMRLAPLFRRMDVPTMNVRVRGSDLLFQDTQGTLKQSISLDRRTVKAWTAWLPPQPMPLHKLFYDVDINTLADDIHAQLRGVAEQIIAKNTEVLSPEYVKIRDDVLRSRDELLPRKK